MIRTWIQRLAVCAAFALQGAAYTLILFDPRAPQRAKLAAILAGSALPCLLLAGTLSRNKSC